MQPWSQVTVDAGYNIYYVSAAQAIRQMSWPNGATKFADVSINASQPVEPETSVTVDGAGSVYYVDAGHTVHKMYISGGQWVDANLMASTQSRSIVVPGGGVAVDGSANVYYVDPGQTIHEMYWIGTQFVDANLMASSQSGLHVSVAFLISGQVVNGGTGLNGVTVTLSGTTPSGTSVSQTTTTATVNGNDGEYALLAADGGKYTLAPSLSGYVFSPAQQTFGDLTASQAIGFSVFAGTTTGTPPIVITPTTTPDITPPSVVTASASACNDVSGIWKDNTIYENTYSLAQVGSTVSGTVSTFEQGCGAFVSTLQGQATATPGNFTVTSTAPPYDACGYVISPRTATESVTLLGCSQAQVTVSGGAGASGFIGTGGSSSGTVSWIRTSLVLGISVSVDLNSGKVNTSLSGQNKAAALSVAISPSANGTGQSMTLGAHGNAQSGDSFTDSLQRLNLAPGQYGSIVATWDDVAVTVPVAFDVLGGVRFSTYNTPAESQCNTGSPTTVFIFDAGACTYGTHTINSTFAYQTNLNGAGSSLNY